MSTVIDAVAQPSSWSNPARSLRVVTPSDSTNFTDGVCRALYVGTGGNVVVLAAGDTNTVTFSNVPGGFVIPVQAIRVNTTSTTASGIVAMY